MIADIGPSPMSDINQYIHSQAFKTGGQKADFHGIVGRNEKMLELYDTIKQIRSSGEPVLIQGESGTGKELVASAIHRESMRSKRHFVPVNCGALPEGLLESEMFGHVKGAFTGAAYNKKGRFKIADKGTIFLDEISEMSPAMQAKFLRVISRTIFFKRISKALSGAIANLNWNCLKSPMPCAKRKVTKKPPRKSWAYPGQHYTVISAAAKPKDKWVMLRAPGQNDL